MAETDLEDVQHRVNESRQQFLSALAIYEKDGPYDGREITDTYLIRFLGHETKRSPFAKGFAEEAIALISGFGAARTTMTMNVALLNQQPGLFMLHVQVDASADVIRTSFPSLDFETAASRRGAGWPARCA